MNDTQITIRTDDATKRAVAKFAKSLGLSTGAFLMAAARDAMGRGKVTLTPQYNPEFVASIRQAQAEIESGDYIIVEPGQDLREAFTHASL